VVQLYVHKDRDITRHLVSRAGVGQCGALVLTVDTPVLAGASATCAILHAARRHAAANFLAALPELARPRPRRERRREKPGDGYPRCVAHLGRGGLAQSMARMPLLLKGHRRSDDARRAVAAGVDGVIVSNTRGRQLDGAEATLDALPEWSRPSRRGPGL